MAEADEYDRSFLRLAPTIAVITNIDADHLDYYGSLEEIKDAFVEFASKVPFYGKLVVCMDDTPLVSIFPRIEKRLLSYGESVQADLQVRGICHEGGGTSGLVSFRGQELGELRLQVPGEHNVRNALAAVAVGLELGVPFARIAAAMAAFRGVHRRAEIKGEVQGRLVMDDYAHHPSEIMATLDGIKKGWGRRIIAVFQPHLYSRTRRLADEFGSSFRQSDLLVVTDVYGAREEPDPEVTGLLVAEAARRRGHRAVVYHPDRSTLAGPLFELSRPGDIILTMGAGDIWKVGEELLDSFGGTRA